MSNSPVNYHDYLKIDQLLSCQQPLGDQLGRPAHDEHLFIVIHQVYELWFKQILHDVDSVLKLFEHESINEKDMNLMVSRLERVVEIQRLLVDQINVLETMTPLDFLDFRDLLFPASGFQSFQFRVLENKLGLKASHRLPYNQAPYFAHFPESQQKKLADIEAQPSLFDQIDKWLGRTPFLEFEGFDFWKTYKTAVDQMLTKEREMISQSELLAEEGRKRNFAIVDQSEKLFSALFNEQEYEKLKADGQWRLSYRAVHAALFIQLYRDQPVFHLPFRLITKLLDIDEMMTHWRDRHALMARRMLGTKVGTGGSSGAAYLHQSADQHRIFTDFFQLTTFFIPRSSLPALPEQVEKRLDFFYCAEKRP